MRESIRILMQLERAAMAEMEPLYVKAMLTPDKDEREAVWERFRVLFERAYLISGLIGRMGARQSLERPVKLYADDGRQLLVRPWESAIKRFLSKIPNVRSIVDRMRPVARARAFFVTGIENTDALLKIQERITERLSGKPTEGPGFIEKTKADLAAHLSHARLENVLRTNTMTALNEGAMEEVRELGNAVALLQYNSIHDNRTRGAPGTDNAGFHWQLDGFLERPDHPVWMSMTPPLGWQCFVPETEVQGAFVGGSKTFYSGPVVKFQTRKGNRLTCTPNHPILTRRGWIAANLVTELDDLLAYQSEIGVVNRPADSLFSAPLVFRGAVPNQNMPTAIKDVFYNLLIQGGFSVVPCPLPMNFHGDAKWFDGDIHVVGTYRGLPEYSIQSGLQEFRKLMFVDRSNATEFSGHSLGTQTLLCETDGPSFGRFPCGTALPFNSGGIELDLLPLEIFRSGMAADLNASVYEKLLNGHAAGSDLFFQLLEAGTGCVCIDNCVRIDRGEFSGHVYDLQSVSGWMVANNIVTSNCRCNISSVSWGSAERMGFADAINRTIYQSALDQHNAVQWKIIRAGLQTDPGFSPQA